MTGATDPEMSGEARLKSRRRSFWRFATGGVVIAMIVGFATGEIGDMVAAGTLPGWGLVVMWSLAVASFIWFSVEYFRRVDELDLLDNLWACMVGFYFYATALITWLLFHEVEMLGPPDQYVIFFTSFVAMFATYGLRKLGWR